MELHDITVSDVIAAVHFKTTEKSWTSSPRGHHILAYQISGEFPHDFGSRTLTAKADTVLFFNKSEPFSAVQREVGESIAIHLTTANDIDIPSFIIPAKGPSLRTSFERLYQVCMRFDPSDRHRIMAMTYELLYCVDALRGECYHPRNERLQRVTDYIREHFRESISNEALASLYGVSSRRLTDLFRSAYGISPAAYILDYRLNIAKQLLEYSTLSVSDVAAEAGFSDITYFSRVFKNKIGVTPSKYRRNNTAR